MGAFGDPIPVRPEAVRDDFGVTFEDTEVDVNLGYSQNLQDFILSNDLVEDEESVGVLRDYLGRTSLAEGIFVDLRGSDVLEVVSAEDLIGQARVRAYATREFARFFGKVVFRLKAKYAPMIYRLYGFSDDQVRVIIEDGVRVKHRYPTYTESILLAGNPVAGKPPRDIREETMPTPANPLWAEQGEPLTDYKL